MLDLQFKNFDNKLIYTMSLLLYLLPIALVTGSFLPDLFIIIIGVIFLFLTFKKKLFIYYNNNFFKIFILWYAYIVIRSLLTSDPLFSLESSLFYFRFGIFSLAVWFLIEFNKNSIKILGYFIFFTLGILSVDSIFQFFIGFNLIGIPYNGYRVSSFFGEELKMGSFIVRFLPILLCIYFINLENFIKYKNALLILTYFICFSVFLSAERLAIFYLFLTLCLSMIIFFNKKNIILFLSVTVISFILLLTFSEKHYERIILDTFSTQFYTYDQDSKKRFFIFSKAHEGHIITAYNIFKSNTLFGKGPKMFRKLCDKKEFSYSNELTKHSCSTHPHNTLIQILSSIGIFGFAPFLLFYVYIFYRAIYFAQNLFKTSIKKSEFLICFIILINFFPFFPSGSFYNNWLGIIYYLPIGIFLYLHYKVR